MECPRFDIHSRDIAESHRVLLRVTVSAGAAMADIESTQDRDADGDKPLGKHVDFGPVSVHVPGETIEHKMVRFRTLGCYPLTGGVESNATTLPEIIQEMLLTKTSERQGRMIDKDAGGAGMEEKKKQGYF